jgi:hypothetical protein
VLIGEQVAPRGLQLGIVARQRRGVAEQIVGLLHVPEGVRGAGRAAGGTGVARRGTLDDGLQEAFGLVPSPQRALEQAELERRRAASVRDRQRCERCNRVFIAAAGNRCARAQKYGIRAGARRQRQQLVDEVVLPGAESPLRLDEGGCRCGLCVGRPRLCLRGKDRRCRQQQHRASFEHGNEHQPPQRTQRSLE